jgi:DNA-binding transcriptional MerR regulator
MDELTIGKLAKQANVHVETLRYYERRAMIPKPRRTVANYRLYSPENLRQVKFIKQAQGLGFSLKEIKKLLALRATPGRSVPMSERMRRTKSETLTPSSIRSRLCARLFRICWMSAPVKDRRPNVQFLNRSSQNNQ